MAIHQDQEEAAEEKVDRTNRLEGRDNIEESAATRDNFFPVSLVLSIQSKTRQCDEKVVSVQKMPKMSDLDNLRVVGVYVKVVKLPHSIIYNFGRLF